jgi:hypothetical protein
MFIKKGSQRRRRSVIFVCSVTNVDSIEIETSSREEAISIFYNKFNINPVRIFGPFYRKKVFKKIDARILKFDKISRRAIYDGWLVDAFLLKEPADTAYLVFIKREDGKLLPVPKGTTVVHISNLEFLR